MPHQWIKEYTGNYQMSIWSGPFSKKTLYNDSDFLKTYFWLYTQGKKNLQIFSANENSFMAQLDIIVEGTQEILIDTEFKQAYEQVVQEGTTKTYWMQVHGTAGEGIHGFMSDGEVRIQFVLIGGNGQCFLYLRSAIDHQRDYDQNEILTLTFKAIQTKEEQDARWTKQSYHDLYRGISFRYPQGWKLEEKKTILKLLPDSSFWDSMLFIHTVQANGHTQPDHSSILAYFEQQITEINSAWGPPKRVGKIIPVEAFGQNGVLVRWDQKNPKYNLMQRVRLYLAIKADCIICLWAQGVAEDAKKRDKVLMKVFQSFSGTKPRPIGAYTSNTQPSQQQTTTPSQSSSSNRIQNCTFCHGSGMITCSSCNGMGYHTSSYTSIDWQGNPEYINQDIPCGCSGGRTTCPSCGGSGMK